jgi:hypothetical protein
MAYTINLTDGQIFATVADGTINTSSSMVLVGKNYAGYGEFLDENFIHLLENGSNNVPPGAPLVGQLWWDKSTSTMKVYTGTAFKVISAATSSSTAPANNVTGDLWWDTQNQQLKVWNGSTFVLIGPSSTAGQGQTGAIATTVIGQDAVPRFIAALYSGNVLVGTVSQYATFSPQTAIPGFDNIGPGLQLSTAGGLNAQFRGTANNATFLNGISSSSFMRSDTNTSTTGTLGVLNDTGITFGLDQDGRLSVDTATSAVEILNQTSSQDLRLRVSPGGTPTNAMVINGATLAATFSGDVSLPSITKSGANGVGNIGSSTNSFNTIFAKATSAQYADVAERFAADTEIQPGTVVEIGGTAEITISQHELSENVFGVISTRAAYLMNDGVGPDTTHPAVAMTGRVPVRCVGKVNKGDRLVSAGAGLARAALPGEATPFNVIGRALEDKLTQETGMVEAIVTIK